MKQQRKVLAERKPHTCEVCEKTFTRKDGLAAHLRSHTGEKPFQCGTCGGRFSRKDNLRLHEKTHAREKALLRPEGCDAREEETEPIPEERPSKASGYECDVCGSLFACPEAMARHRRRHPHMLPDRKHRCPHCSYSTDVWGSLRAHLLVHTRLKAHRCLFCEKTFTRKGVLALHLLTHTGEKPFQCATCKRGFARKGCLRTHERTHTREKPYLCPECGRAFIRQSELKKHQRTHTSKTQGETLQQECNPSLLASSEATTNSPEREGRRDEGGPPSSSTSWHECDVCHALFASLEAMASHRRSHPHLRPDRRHKCPSCHYSTDVSSSLAAHLLGHERTHACDLCKKAFTLRSNLENHLRIHTGERPFRCDACGRRFTQKANLLRHQKMHTGERPHPCPECGRGFAHRSDLKRHRRIHAKAAQVPLPDSNAVRSSPLQKRWQDTGDTLRTYTRQKRAPSSMSGQTDAVP